MANLRQRDLDDKLKHEVNLDRIEKRKKRAEIREVKGLETVSCVIRKDIWRWFGNMEQQDGADCIKPWRQESATFEEDTVIRKTLL